MAPLLRRRLRCFFCGYQSKQKGVVGLQQWQCETCEAVNHLDENGEITDPPALEEAPNVRYAQTIERPVPPVFTAPDETLFCRTCITNQHFLTQALASYLPSPTDPRYPEYEKKYPEYRQGLEERYPQVCDQCEPRVLERIRATGYAAKTDHLRRMMDNTRGSRSTHDAWSWRYIVVYGGALGWSTALVGHIFWNVLGAMARSGGELREDTDPLCLQSCLEQSLRYRNNAVECADLAQPCTTMALALGFLTIWWNPCLVSKLRGTTGRMLGLIEYYKLQGILNVTRLLVWYSLGEDRGLVLDSGATKAVHAIMLVFNLIICLVSFRTARIDSTPRVIFQDSPLPDKNRKSIPKQAQSAPLSSAPISSLRPFNSQTQSLAGRFLVERSATPSQATYTSSYRPPTPPPDDDGDEMDWTPVRNAFQPRASVQTQQPARIPMELFEHYKRLPVAPISQEQRLRNPPNQSRFRKASAAQQQKFFDRITSSVSALSDDESETDCQGGQRNENSPNPMHPIKLAPPSYWPPEDLETETGLETGLESLLNGVFSLADDPLEIRAERQVREQQLENDQSLSEENNLLQVGHAHNRAAWQRIISILLLSLACLAWSYAGTGPQEAQLLRFAALGTAAVVAGRGLFDAFRKDTAIWKPSDIMVLGLELSTAILLGRNAKLHSVQEDVADENYGSGPMWLLGVLLIQELCAFSGEIRASTLRDSLLLTEEASVHVPASGLIAAPQPESCRNLALMQPDVCNGFTAHEANDQLATRKAPPREAADMYESISPSKNLPGLSLGRRMPGKYQSKSRNEAEIFPRRNI